MVPSDGRVLRADAQQSQYRRRLGRGREVDLSPLQVDHLVSMYPYGSAEGVASRTDKHVGCLSDRERHVLTHFVTDKTIQGVGDELALPDHHGSAAPPERGPKLLTQNAANSVAEATIRHRIFLPFRFLP
jgi:hypothetical protein